MRLRSSGAGLFFRRNALANRLMIGQQFFGGANPHSALCAADVENSNLDFVADFDRVTYRVIETLHIDLHVCPCGRMLAPSLRRHQCPKVQTTPIGGTAAVWRREGCVM